MPNWIVPVARRFSCTSLILFVSCMIFLLSYGLINILLFLNEDIHFFSLNGPHTDKIYTNSKFQFYINYRLLSLVYVPWMRTFIFFNYGPCYESWLIIHTQERRLLKYAQYRTQRISRAALSAHTLAAASLDTALYIRARPASL
jgi:hypothetical protein